MFPVTKHAMPSKVLILILSSPLTVQFTLHIGYGTQEHKIGQT